MPRTRKSSRRANNEGGLRYRKDRNRWEAQYPVEGKRVTRYFATQEHALEWLLEMRMKKKRGVIDPDQDSVYDYLKTWHESRKPNPNDPNSLARSTYQLYDRVLNNCIFPFCKDNPIKLAELKRAYVKQLLESAKEAKVSSRYRQIAHRIIHKASNDAIVDELIETNPAELISIKHTYRKSHPLDSSQVRHFLESAMGSRFYALYLLACMTGAREGELLGLLWDDIDWENGTINIQRQVMHLSGGEFIFADPKTEAGKRLIKLGRDTLNDLREHKKNQEMEKRASGELWKEWGLIFPTSRHSVSSEQFAAPVLL